MAPRRRPEVLAPVGSPDCLPAAVAGGADAVFLGLRHFNARGRAENFRKAELPHHVAYLHGHGVKCYLVMNTLVHDDEYPKALDLAASAHAAGVDAVIVQDLGLWRTLARELPGLHLHASTQMTVHDPSQVAALAALGAQRVILARELTLAEVAACTREAARLGIETEHFVHGALCYAFSGQCLMSNFAGCRSANRGTCAQNCRFDYVAADAGAAVETDPDTLISMKDLALVGEIAALADAGVASLKIEGRLKGPDYVYTTSRIYRAATEAWQAGKKLDLAAARELLKDVFARPHTAAPLAGVYGESSRLHRYDPAQDRTPDATLISGDRARGEVVVRSRVAVTAGQGFAFAVGFYTGGFLVIAADRDPRGRDLWRCKVRIPPHGPRLVGELPLFRNADHERKREAVAAMAQVPVGAAPEATVALAISASGGKGAPLSVAARSADGRSADVHGSVDLAPAANAPLDAALFRDKFGAFGGTGFALGALDWQVAGGLFVPASELKALRRALVDALAAQTPQAPVEEPASAVRWAPPEPGTPRRRRTALWVACGSLAGARAALAAGADAAWLDDATLDLWSAAPPVLDSAGFAPGTLWLRHPATAAVSPHLRALALPVVAGHLGVIRAAHAAGLAVTADLFCNVFSSSTLLALHELGAGAAVISLECSGREVARLAARCAQLAAPPALALVVHGRLPAMLTRQDHGLAAGATRAVRAVARDGGLPYTLQRRRHGDTVIWEGRRLCAPAHVQPTAGLVDAWVLELADLDAAEIAELVTAYAGLRDGTISGAAVAEVARRHAPDGLFPGHLEQGSRELDLVVERMEGAEDGLPE